MFPRGLVVSCQTPEASPLRNVLPLSLLANAAEGAGAVAIRAEGADSIREIKAKVQVPVIGLIKSAVHVNQPYITSSLEAVKEIVNAGADYIAIDATGRPREDYAELTRFVEAIKKYTSIPIIGDVSRLIEGAAAIEAGIDILATTLAGYTDESKSVLPDLKLVEDLISLGTGYVIAEGGYRQANEVIAAMNAGAHAVCIGAAITDSWSMTKYFVQAMNGAS